MHTIKGCNKALDKLQKELLNQLNSTNIEYIDLYTYYKRVESIKNKKNALYIDSY